MVIMGLFSLITAVALPSVNIISILLTRVTSIILILAFLLSYNRTDIQYVDSGIGLYSGLFDVTSVSQCTDSLIFRVGSIIILGWAPVVGNKDGKDEYNH